VDWLVPFAAPQAPAGERFPDVAISWVRSGTPYAAGFMKILHGSAATEWRMLLRRRFDDVDAMQLKSTRLPNGH
jgi:hypothetical protein